MNMFSPLGIIGIIIGSILGAFVVFAQAGTYQTALDECQKRVGLGEGLCKTFIKNNLDVASCKKQTGLSDDECAKRIEEIRNDPDFSGGTTSEETRPPATSNASVLAPPISVGGSVITELRITKERQLIELQSKTRELIGLLKEKGADVSVAEKNFGEFEKKSEELLSAYGAFQATYLDTLNDSDSTRMAIRDKAREIVTRSRHSFIEYYRADIFDPLRTAYKQIL